MVEYKHPHSLQAPPDVSYQAQPLLELGAPHHMVVAQIVG